MMNYKHYTGLGFGLGLHCKTWWVRSTQTVWGNRLP